MGKNRNTTSELDATTSSAETNPVEQAARGAPQQLPTEGGSFTYDADGRLIPYTPPSQE